MIRAISVTLCWFFYIYLPVMMYSQDVEFDKEIFISCIDEI